MKIVIDKIKLLTNSFFIDVLKLTSGTAIAQVLVIVASPILTRLYSPKSFGILQLYVSIISILSLIICLRYDISIMLSKDDKEANELLILSIIIGVLLSISIQIILQVFGKSLISLIRSPELLPFIKWVPFISFIMGIISALGYWNSRKRKYGIISLNRIINSGIIIFIQFSFAFIGAATGASLIYANIFGTLSSGLFLLFVSKNDCINKKKTVSISELLFLLKKYSKFPLLEIWSTLCNTISWQLPSFMLAYYFDKTMVGYFSLAFRLINIPLQLIGASISQVFFQRVSKLIANGQSITNIVGNTYEALVSLLIFPALLLGVIGKELFSLIFGKEWATSGIFVQILSLWMVVWFISSPLSSLFNILQKQEKALLLNILILITRFLALWIGGIQKNIYLSLEVYSLSGIILYGYLIFWALSVSGIKITRALKVIGTNVLYSFPILFVIGGKYFIKDNTVIIIFIAFIVCIIYYLILIKRKPYFLKEIVIPTG